MLVGRRSCPIGSRYVPVTFHGRAIKLREPWCHDIGKGWHRSISHKTLYQSVKLFILYEGNLNLTLIKSLLPVFWQSPKVYIPGTLLWPLFWLEFRPCFEGFSGLPLKNKGHLSHEKKRKPPTFHDTGWSIGILITVYYNPYNNWGMKFHPLYNQTNQGPFFIAHLGLPAYTHVTGFPQQPVFAGVCRGQWKF